MDSSNKTKPTSKPDTKKCKICVDSFKSKKSLKRHNFKKHLGVQRKKQSCPYCEDDK